MWDSKLSDMSLKPTMLSCKVNYVQLCWLETHTLKPKTSVPSAGDHLGPRRIWDIRRRRGLIPTKDQDEGSGRRVQERGNDSHLSEDYGKYSLIPVICFFLFTPLSGILTTVFTSFRCFVFLIVEMYSYIAYSFMPVNDWRWVELLRGLTWTSGPMLCLILKHVFDGFFIA